MRYELKQVQIVKTFRDAAIDYYTDYVYDRFEKIDIKYPEDEYWSQYTVNTGAKGEVILEPIVDITMWLFDYRLGIDYSVKPYFSKNSYTGREGVDYRVFLKQKIIDIEAKNYRTGWNQTPKQFKKNVLDRYDTDPSIYRALMINQSHVKKFSKDFQSHNINIISIPFFMKNWENKKSEIKSNITEGIEQFTSLISVITRDTPQHGQSISLQDCINFGMPYWFIEKYHPVGEQHIKNTGSKIGAFNRTTAKWRVLEKYRHLHI